MGPVHQPCRAPTGCPGGQGMCSAWKCPPLCPPKEPELGHLTWKPLQLPVGQGLSCPNLEGGQGPLEAQCVWPVQLPAGGGPDCSRPSSWQDVAGVTDRRHREGGGSMDGEHSDPGCGFSWVSDLNHMLHMTSQVGERDPQRLVSLAGGRQGQGLS